MLLIRYLFYPVAAALGMLVVLDSLQAARFAQAAADMHSLGGSTRLAWAEMLETLSLALYPGAGELRAAYTRLAAQAAAAAASAVAAAVALIALGALHLAQLGWAARGCPRLLAWHLNLVGVIAFAVGISAPMLTVVAHTQVPVLGEVILQHESKSIVSTARTLARGGDYLLCVLVVAFSMVVPAFKVALVASAVQSARARVRARSVHILHAVGKWSMADVFVVAVLVASLALDRDAHGTATIGPGLYFFAAYCLLAMGASHHATRAALP